MSNYTETVDVLTSYVKARIPFVSLRTVEPSRVLDAVRQVASSLHLTMYVHTASSGLRDLTTTRQITEDKSVYGALELAAEQFQTRHNLTFVFSEPSMLESDTETARQFMDLVTLASERGGAVFAITSDPVWPKIQRKGMSVVLDAPDVGEMYEIISKTVDDNRSPSVLWGSDDMRTAATILAGMTQLEAENILLHMIAGGQLQPGDYGDLSRAKDRVFSDLAGIERVDLRGSSATVGGLDGLRTWLAQERPFLTMDLGARQMRAPRGVLLVGVPGCGKSLSAKAVAQSWDLPLYRLDMASILGQYVGQSESRLREAFETADHVAPCVLWIDEIEKALSGGSGDTSGVTTRLIGQFLFWLQESKGKVYVVATANDVRALPPELMRQGRFDQIFFVDLPTPDERQEIIEIYLQRYVERRITDEQVAALVQRSDGFAGSDIDAAVREIGKAEMRSGSVDDRTVELCFDNIVPLSRTSPERIEEIRQWGRERAMPASGRGWSPTTTSQGVPRRTVLLPHGEA